MIADTTVIFFFFLLVCMILIIVCQSYHRTRMREREKSKAGLSDFLGLEQVSFFVFFSTTSKPWRLNYINKFSFDFSSCYLACFSTPIIYHKHKDCAHKKNVTKNWRGKRQAAPETKKIAYFFLLVWRLISTRVHHLFLFCICIDPTQVLKRVLLPWTKSFTYLGDFCH